MPIKTPINNYFTLPQIEGGRSFSFFEDLPKGEIYNEYKTEKYFLFYRCKIRMKVRFYQRPCAQVLIQTIWIFFHLDFSLSPALHCAIWVYQLKKVVHKPWKNFRPFGNHI